MNDAVTSRPEMRIGNARVSTADQTLALLLDALRSAGCERIYQETAIGKQTDRPELAQALKALRQGVFLVLWRLDGLGRPLPQLIQTVASIEALGASFESITEKIDTHSATGRRVFHLFSALAEFERKLISERTREVLQAARRRGIKGGSKPVLDATAVEEVRSLMADRSTSPATIVQRFKINKCTRCKLVRSGATS